MQSTGKTKWTGQEIEALVGFLHEHRSERMADPANFEEVTFNVAMTHLQLLLVSGKPKDLKSKWGQVSSTGCQSPTNANTNYS